jgi:hypothetical protein
MTADVALLVADAEPVELVAVTVTVSTLPMSPVTGA